MRPEHQEEAAALRARLGHVYWIGGGSGAGKSVTARRLAGQHGLSVYSTDEAMADHGRRFSPYEAPLLSTFKTMDMDERWLLRSPQAMLDSFHWFHGELFSLIIEDLVRLPPEPGVIAEGFRLLPQLVKPLLAQPDHAVWLLPTPEFRRAAFTSRGSLWQIAGQTSDPDRALDNLLERDRLFTDLLRAETKRLELPAIEIASPMTEDDLAGRVSAIFGL
jgi:2-phosphoglycerate kinase